MIAGLHYVWCLFVGLLMRKTFGLTPQALARGREELRAMRIAHDRAMLQVWTARELEAQAVANAATYKGLADARIQRLEEVRTLAQRYRQALEDIASRGNAWATQRANVALVHGTPTQPGMPAVKS